LLSKCNLFRYTMGRRVEGVVDGAFDVGYFLTVRVNGCLLRGVVWREDTCMRAVGQHAMVGAVHVESS
jgi:hypothetical protein